LTIKSKNIRRRYLFIGLAFGFSFPIFALIADCFIFNDLPFSFESFSTQIWKNPIHFIVLLAPIVLGITFYVIGRSIERQNQLNRKLSRINESIINSNESLDSFNYHVSHDLKTILNNQFVLSKMILKYSKNEDYLKINEISNKLISISENGIKTVLSFLEISKNGFTESKEIVKAIDITAQLKRVLAENDLGNKIDVQLKRKDFDDFIIGEKIFESIVLNLLTNAIKYNTSESPKMEVELIAAKRSKQFRFKDNGIGIDLEKNGESLFKPFNRIPTENKTEGTGIGLFLVKKIVNSIGGELTVESELGKGTTFIIIFEDNVD